MGAEQPAGSFGIVVVAGAVVAVDPGLGVAQGCIDLPRLGSNSFPPCLPCQVGADCTVPDVAAERIVEAAAGSAGTGYPWAVPGASRRCLSAGTDRGYPRPVRWRRADEKSSLAADATAADDSLPALGTLAHGDRSSGLTVVCPGRSSVLWLLGPCVL